MRITFLCPFASLAGGVRVVAIYAAQLQALGHDVTVVSISDKTPPLKARIKSMLGRQALKPRREATPLLDVLGSKHKILDKVGQITAADVPEGDVVIATYWETAPWVADLPPSKGRKFYLIQDYETFKKGHADAVSATYQLPLKKIGVSEYIAGMLAQYQSIDDVKVVPNAVDCDQFSAPARPKGASLTVGFLYTGKPRKNVKMAIEIVERARDVIPDLNVVAFGSIEPIEKLPLPDWVRYQKAPPQDEISSIYAACDAWLFTSEHEGFGLPILESMACGTPVLATHAGAAPQIIDGLNGTLLDQDVDAFVAEMQRVDAMSPQAWSAMSDAARKTAQSYSWEAATAQLLECLHEKAAS